MASSFTASGFTKDVAACMNRCYPEANADKAWDNVGLILDSLEKPSVETSHQVLLTTDLTTSVVDEAIALGVSVVVAYHPIIFRGLKSITLANTQQASLIRLASANIAVYCPHTALDAAVGGINDWLAGKVVASAEEATAPSPHVTTEPIQRVPGPDCRVGYGRTVQLGRAVDAFALARGVAQRLGDQRHVLIAPPRRFVTGQGVRGGQTVTSVAVCAGSGADVLRGSPSDVGMYITGEMSHHDVLAATEQGVWVVCLLHSNSERLFLAETLQDTLQAQLRTIYDDAIVTVSATDRDPFVFWDVNEAPPSLQQPEPVPV